MALIPRAVAEKRESDQARMRTQTSARSQGDRWLNAFWRAADDNMTWYTATPSERDAIKATVERIFWTNLTARVTRDTWNRATRSATDRFNAVMLDLAKQRLQLSGIIEPTVQVISQVPTTWTDEAAAALGEALASMMQPDETSAEYWEAYYEALGAYDGV